jgi:MFS transporter, ACS family, allantoate permease
LTLSTFSVGNIIGSEIFQAKDAPDYIPGKIAIMILLAIQLFVSFLLRWINLRLNQQKRARIEEMRAQFKWSPEDEQRERERYAFMDLTDKQ